MDDDDGPDLGDILNYETPIGKQSPSPLQDHDDVDYSSEDTTEVITEDVFAEHVEGNDKATTPDDALQCSVQSY